MKILKLTLKKKWFDMIASGEKKEEYREPSDWINSRVNAEKFYDAVEFSNGYGPKAPKVTLEYKGFRYRGGKEKWGANPLRNYVVILLGEIIPNTP